MQLISSQSKECTINKPTTSVVSFFYLALALTSLNCRYVDQWFVVMSTQLIGFSIGGVGRRFLVTPPSMIWPINLVNCALFNTLHSHQYAGIGTRGGLSRERFFVYAFTASFLWCEFKRLLSISLSNLSYRMLQRFPPRIYL